MAGWVILFLSFFLLLISRYKRNKREGKRTSWQKIGIGFMGFVLVIGIIAYISTLFSDAFKAAKILIARNPETIGKVGQIRSVALVPYGLSVSMSTTDSGDSKGEAEFNLIIHGTKRDADAIIFLSKEWKTDWTIIGYSVE